MKTQPKQRITERTEWQPRGKNKIRLSENWSKKLKNWVGK